MRGEGREAESFTCIEGETTKRASGWTCARRFCASQGQYGDAKGAGAANRPVCALFRMALEMSATNCAPHCCFLRMNGTRRRRGSRRPPHRVTETCAKSAGPHKNDAIAFGPTAAARLNFRHAVAPERPGHPGRLISFRFGDETRVRAEIHPCRCDACGRDSSRLSILRLQAVGTLCADVREALR